MEAGTSSICGSLISMRSNHILVGGSFCARGARFNYSRAALSNSHPSHHTFPHIRFPFPTSFSKNLLYTAKCFSKLGRKADAREALQEARSVEISTPEDQSTQPKIEAALDAL